jgi:hypothetical protein
VVVAEIGSAQGSFNYISSRSDFGFEFAEIFINKNGQSSTLRLVELGIDDSPTHQCGEFSFKYSKADSPSLRLS